MMIIVYLCVGLRLFSAINAYYNPVPMGSVIVTTTRGVHIFQPEKYGGNDAITKIYATNNQTNIVYSVFDPTSRYLYLLHTNSSMNGTIFSQQLVFREQLSPIAFQLPIVVNPLDVNQTVSFSSDVENNRAFLVQNNGTVVMFSITGLMSTVIAPPRSLNGMIVSATYNNLLNRLFLVTSTNLYSCSGLDTNDLQCCVSIQGSTSLRAAFFDPKSSDTDAYLVDRTAGISRVPLNATGCPRVPLAVTNMESLVFNQAVINDGLFFYSASASGASDNSYLVIYDGQKSRRISIGEPIVALAIAAPSQTSTSADEETCFNGITYSDYRVAVVLAALFGTIMGIFMCCNALFCIDFFMTKSIIRSLKKQIPHDLLEDRWNKLVEEKYAKIALEKARKREDPPPNARRISSAGARRTSSAANAGATQTTNSVPIETLQVPNPVPKIAAYLRRKSESYLSRRRSDDYRTTHDGAEGGRRNQLNVPPQIHIGPVEEEAESRTTGGLRQNLSRRELLKNDEDFL